MSRKSVWKRLLPGIRRKPIYPHEKSASEAAAFLLKEYGRIDVLINNAAYMRAGETVENQNIRELSMFQAVQALSVIRSTVFCTALWEYQHPAMAFPSLRLMDLR